MIRSLRLVIAIKQQRIPTRPPRIRIAESPHRNTDAVRDIQARARRSLVFRGRGALDIELGDGALRRHGAEVPHGGRDAVGLALREMALRPDAVDGDAGCAPLADFVDHALGFGVGGGVETERFLVRNRGDGRVRRTCSR
jgi:hypothetical protein